MYYLQSRYYDPVVGRFINADMLVSTGQGLLGNNMFAYCGNNPVSRADDAGDLWSTRVSYLLGRLITAEIKREICIRKNLKNNTIADDNPATTTENRLVNDQNGVTGEIFKYGKYNASWNACETIAIHNAKVLLGMDSKLSTTMWDCQRARIMIGNGYFGSNPLAIGKVLRNYGIDYSKVGPNEMKTPGVYIFSYWNGKPFLSSLHTIAIMYDGQKYTAYNYGESSFNPADYADRFICGYYLGG